MQRQARHPYGLDGEEKENLFFPIERSTHKSNNHPWASKPFSPLQQEEGRKGADTSGKNSYL